MPTATIPEGQRPYKVLRIDELTRLSETGGVERYYRHQIKTRAGVIISVDIDERNFTAEKAGPILSQRATDADKIFNL